MRTIGSLRGNNRGRVASFVYLGERFNHSLKAGRECIEASVSIHANGFRFVVRGSAPGSTSRCRPNHVARNVWSLNSLGRLLICLRGGKDMRIAKTGQGRFEAFF